MEEKAVICKDNHIYKLETDGRWARKEKFVGTVATYEKLPSEIVVEIMPQALYEFVYKGKFPMVKYHLKPSL